MIHRNTKYWSFTWDTNVNQKKLPNKKKLQDFLNNITSNYTFQTEMGTIKSKVHYQGVLNLYGPRLSKKLLLKLFEEQFSNVSGLSLNPVHDKIAIQNYVTKSEGRLDGPFYGGKNEMYDPEMAQCTLRPWQQDLFDLITGDSANDLKERKVIFIQDCEGNTGKSWFQKWLRVGQKKIEARSLPVSSVDRLISAINIITKGNQIDLLNIDLTKTKGEDQSYQDLFSAVEQIKNGYVIDVMYGKYNEAIFKPPIVIIYTNEDIMKFLHYLSRDRWLVFQINKSKLARFVPDADGLYRHYTSFQ